MSEDARRLHSLDTDAHKNLAWIFWAVTVALALTITAAYPPTHAIGRAGWDVAFGGLGVALAYTVRLYAVRRKLTALELSVSVTAVAILCISIQWLQGGYRSPMWLLYTLMVLGGAGVLVGCGRLVHILTLVAGALMPLTYTADMSASMVLTAVVYTLILSMQAAFLFYYGVRLRSHRMALFDAQQDASTRALTDALTGLGNRRALELELDRATVRAAKGDELTIVYLDLDGFKAYNDRFGHGAGDVLLQRLGGAFQACVQGCGKAFRIGGDEFCAVLDGDTGEGHPMIAAIRSSLSEQGTGFRIGPSCGVVAMPRDAADVSGALRIADERMYDQKRGGRPTPAQEISRVLMKVLTEHQPAVIAHAMEISNIARALAKRLGVPEAEVETVARAAELHDIGKIAIPDTVLSKPGPLDQAEWRLVRQHPVIGERILSSSPSFVEIGRTVRASHERIDGNGYPDGLTREEIPLGARIVSVCDAYAAIRSDRPYRAARSEAEAIFELIRCAGSQFDRAVVEALVSELADPGEPSRRLASASVA